MRVFEFKPMLAIFILLMFPITGNAEAATGDNIGISAARRLGEALEFFSRSLLTAQERFGGQVKGTLDQLDKMRADAITQINGFTEDRVKQTATIVDETIQKMRQMLDKALDDLYTLAICTSENFSLSIQKTISNISILGVTINYKPNSSLSGSGQYLAAKEAVLSGLSDIYPTFGAEKMMFAYDELAGFASSAICHFGRNSATAMELRIQSEEFSKAARTWYLVLREETPKPYGEK
jgi:hypothetical protein